jgi:hypothetical protein
MKIGNKRIKGVSKRFWFLVAGIVLFFILVFTFLPSEEQVDPFVTPAFSSQELSRLQPDWIDPYISTYGLKRPENEETAFINNYSLNVGTPFKFQVYIPTEEAATERPSLQVEKFGWSFSPAIFLNPFTPINSENYANLEEGVTQGNPLVLGFPSGNTPTRGRPYEITGLLYWNSDLLSPPTTEEQESGFSTAPVILVASARPLAPTELANPTTHQADLNISYSSGPYKLDLKRIEWSSGREVRICTSLSNVGSNLPVQRWLGLDGFRAQYPQGGGQGESPASPDPESPLGTQESLSIDSTITGYIIFDIPPASSPTEEMTLYVPGLNSLDPESGGQTVIQVTPGQFIDTSKTNMNERGDLASSGCL